MEKIKGTGLTGGVNIKYDGSVSFASADSRKAVHWKNREVLWSDLVDKLSKTTRTHETYAEYIKAPKARQDEIKDVGGFVGGTLANGRRKAGNVLERSMLSLDADFSKGGLWETFTLMYDCAACIYSTHKHTPENNRLRLIIPLKRTVTRDEYQAIGRKVAEVLGIDSFDDTTYEPERLMYWPSTAKDAEFIFEYQDGEWLDPDAVLSEYHDWRDSSQWPVSSRVEKVIHRHKEKAEDPMEKKGIVGAFCRAYDIHEAIEEFLQDHYEKCDTGDNRYSYKHGSTAGGLITYDNKWSFSHHGTDPSSGKLCNAFDLVRIHLFGLKDEDLKEGTPVNRYPSYIAMEEFASNDTKVRKQIHYDRISSANDDFGDSEIEDENSEWLEKLEYDRKGAIKQTIENVRLILDTDQNLKGIIAHDEFSHNTRKRMDPIWGGGDGAWEDKDTSYLFGYLEKKYGITSERVTRVALDIVAHDNKFHPVKEYLNSLAWDGTPRIDSLFVDYFGADANKYTYAATRKTLVAAVARVFEPGCKFDYVLVLVGKQGTRKSLMLGMLGKNWASDNFTFSVHGDKRNVEQLTGVWIMEIPELAGLYGKDADAVKSFFTRRQDEVRFAYAREKSILPRQCIFIGTTNNHDFLTDATGNRRFWPILLDRQKPTKDVVKDLPNEVDQIWAEAVELYKKGEKLYFEDSSLEKIARDIQEQHREVDPWEALIAEWIESPAPPEGYISDFGEDADKSDWVLRERVTVQEVWQGALNERGIADSVPAKRIRRVLRNMPDWEEYVTRAGGISQRAFRRKNKLQNG